MQERRLRGAVDLAAILEFRLESPFPHLAADLLEIGLMLGRQVAGGDQAGRFPFGRSPEHVVRLGQRVKALLGGDPREIADRERRLAPRRPRAVAVHVDPERTSRIFSRGTPRYPVMKSR